MKRRCAAAFTAFVVLIMSVSFFCITASADNDSSPASYVIDIAKVIPDKDELTLASLAQSTAQKTGFNVMIVTTDDIGSPKSDSQAVEYADSTYEQYCGINTDGILLLINCDTKYDIISTSGICINYFSDRRIDSIFDTIWNDLVAEDFTSAAKGFLSCVESYYNSGRDNFQQEIFGREVDTVDAAMGFASTFCFTGFAALIVGVCIYSYYSSQFKLEKPSANVYMMQNSLSFDNNSDTYVGNFTTRTYSPRSSSSGGSHGGSHHSSTHHSHSGGRHGGGGRHR